jgi:S1-C subfamily serine protease
VSGLPVVPLGDSTTTRVGDEVIAIGDALDLGIVPSVSRGIISGLDRTMTIQSGPLTGLLQTDAALSSGNSGGALANTSGQVIGITTAVATDDATYHSQNINFAIPTATALRVLREFGLTLTTG